MSLRIKGKIYQYTQIYLAHEEENDYIYRILPKALDEYLAQAKDAVNEDNWLDFETIVGLHVGRWQSKYGFYSRWIFFGHSWYHKLAHAVCLPFIQLYTDIQYLVRRLRSKRETRD